MVRLGVAIPQTDIGADALVIGEFVCEAERVGYRHVATYDHVLGANVANRPDWEGPYTSAHTFHDSFVLFGYLAAVTDTIELSSQVLILPQRQTALVAKQAASVDVLSNGRLRLGVGTGWNPVEYVGLGENFDDRGRRSTEQADVLRRLWTDPHVTFSGSWHEIPDAGINPMPIQQPIPLWFGGSGDRVMERIARHGDGWITLYHQPDDAARSAIARLSEHVHGAGRARSDVGIDAWVSMGDSTPDEWRREVHAWVALGVSHITLNTAFHVGHHKRIRGTTAAEHLEAISTYIDAVGDLL
ncbi:MAG: TIGR03619 family F420-dependent LLM class oxidoreductase [Proteobacteria bacterium]|nr:TIGR03619 family F420-dependent LLM class oxidoreductase [Pseudomonadota bacterium]